MVLLAKKEKKCHFGIDVSAKIRDVFGDDQIKWPPFHLVQVCLADLGSDDVMAHRAGEVLSAAEMKTFQGFRFSHRRREWLAGRLAVKEAAALLLNESPGARGVFEIGVDDRGKPFLATYLGGDTSIHVAISHSGGVALGLASFAPCALDIQEIRPSLTRVESRFARAEEKELFSHCYIDKLSTLGLLWAGKEALRKYAPLWPLLGFLEAGLEKVVGHGDGFSLSFQAISGKRDLPVRLPAVWATLVDENALAIILDDSGQG